MEENVTVEEKENIEKKKKIGWLKIFLIVILLFVIIGASVFYRYVALYYEKHFFVGTIINGVDYSNWNPANVIENLNSQVQNYVINVYGRGEEQGKAYTDVPSSEFEPIQLSTITAADVDLQLQDVSNLIDEILAGQNEWMWIQMLGKKTFEYSIPKEITFDEDKLKEFLEKEDFFKESKMIHPRNAYLEKYDEELQSYVISQATYGTCIEKANVLERIASSIVNLTNEMYIEDDCYIGAAVTGEDKELQENLSKVNLWLQTAITYDWNGTKILLDKELMKEWVSIKDNQPELDEEAVANFIYEHAKENDTYGKSRKFVTVQGNELSLPSGAYGWKTDKEGEKEELLQLIYQGSVSNREPLYICRGACKGANDIGSSYVEIDMTNQHLYLFKNGEIVLESDFVSGDVSVGNTTPPGVFGITYKTTNAILRGANYATPVNYWMPFNGNIGMHDATWRSSFGGDIYLTNGSHGCINLPLDKAAEIYQYMSAGFPVVCYYYQ